MSFQYLRFLSTGDTLRSTQRTQFYKFLEDGGSFINPKKLSESLSISALTTSKRISNLVDRGFIELELVKGNNGKEKEIMNIKQVKKS